MDQTPNLQLPYIMPSQAQKHVTHNEAIRALDALVQMAVLDRGLASPPLSPAEGDRYLIAVGGLGAWLGKDGDIAAWQDGAWAFFTPLEGWLVWVADESRLLCHDGLAFIDAAVHSINPALLIGVNSTADATDRLSVKSPASLFDHEGGDHRMKINKETAGDTASLLFQSGYSGRAEFGLTGNDDWSVKVSPDGVAWVDALKVDRSTGRVRLPAGLALGDDDQAVARRHVREKLAANRTYYVRTDGSDANTGLVDSAGGAFLTIQKGIAALDGLDLAGFTVTIQVGAGTWTAGATISRRALGGSVILAGDATTPANVHISTAGTCITVQSGAVISVQGFKLSSSASRGLFVNGSGSACTISGNMDFGVCGGAQMLIGNNGYVLLGANYAISGTSAAHIQSLLGGLWEGYSRTVTITGSPAFAGSFVAHSTLGNCNTAGMVFSGAVTGPRYSSVTNAVINTNGGGASYFPGSVAGTTATGGQYA